MTDLRSRLGALLVDLRTAGEPLRFAAEGQESESGRREGLREAADRLEELLAGQDTGWGSWDVMVVKVNGLCISLDPFDGGKVTITRPPPGATQELSPREFTALVQMAPDWLPQEEAQAVCDRITKLGL